MSTIDAVPHELFSTWFPMWPPLRVERAGHLRRLWGAVFGAPSCARPASDMPRLLYVNPASVVTIVDASVHPYAYSLVSIRNVPDAVMVLGNPLHVGYLLELERVAQ